MLSNDPDMLKMFRDVGRAAGLLLGSQTSSSMALESVC
jgi:hypothetical protein